MIRTIIDRLHELEFDDHIEISLILDRLRIQLALPNGELVSSIRESNNLQIIMNEIGVFLLDQYGSLYTINNDSKLEQYLICTKCSYSEFDSKFINNCADHKHLN